MADVSVRPPAAFNPVGRAWLRISPRLVPVLAVLTALLITIPFMILTGGQGDVRAGLAIAGTAYSALIEGATGLARSDLLSPDNLNLARAFAGTGDPVDRRELRGMANLAAEATVLGFDQVRLYGDVLARLPADLDDEALTDLAGRIETIETLGVETLAAMRPLITDLAALERGDVRDLAEATARLDELTPEARAEIEAVAPAAADYSDADLLAYMRIVDEEGVVALERTAEAAETLDAAGIAPGSREAEALTQIAALREGAGEARDLAALVERMEAAGIVDGVALAGQLGAARELYSLGLLTAEDVGTALTDELETASAENLIVQRPGGRLLVAPGAERAGIVASDNNTPDDTSDDRPDTVYLRLFNSALLFFPANLEAMLLRSLPYIIGGLAVALGFKAGLFNIGVEGQLYIGATLAVWIGFAPLFAGLPALVHVPLVIVLGILGGALWGAIPGALKAFTGAHEVIVTIMLNFVAIRLVDWLIKSTNPVILLDPAASTPRTPFIGESARLPGFDDVAPLLYILAGVAVAAVMLASRREALRRDARAAIRPVVYGLLVAGGGLFLSWIAVRGNLHLGLVVMVLAVLFTDWFLNRTTLGFELRTVGSNPDAARYAGMSVPRNIILALALSGALAGLTGAIQVSGTEFKMQPDLLGGIGFDSIAVALLARTNPRNMIIAGLLWGALLTGAGLMQVRADISIDLVKIIQALIIMFIAADAIIRILWRVPKPAEKTQTTFSKGWGS